MKDMQRLEKRLDTWADTQADKRADRHTRSGRAGRRRLAATLLLCVLFTSSAWAGQWEQLEDGAWRYEQDGSYATGWIQADGLWYYLDQDTGLWVERPALTETAACHLLENAVNRAGWYQSEQFPLQFSVTSSGGRTMKISVLLETAPSQVSSTLGTFEVDIRQGTAKELSTKLVLDLYAY